jgi:short-subunit dehydrogenase involved in D-alanine esterification of teichoic acids
MKVNENTIFITGGGSGIGRGLGEAFYMLGNQGVIGGRREDVLQETAAANPGMKYIVFDQREKAAIHATVQQLREQFPALNVLVNNASMQLTGTEPMLSSFQSRLNSTAEIPAFFSRSELILAMTASPVLLKVIRSSSSRVDKGSIVIRSLSS